MRRTPVSEPARGEGGRRAARLAGWLVAANALVLLAAGSLPAPVREAAGQFAAWCGIG